jgi:hypothetical protein
VGEPIVVFPLLIEYQHATTLAMPRVQAHIKIDSSHVAIFLLIVLAALASRKSAVARGQHISL